MSDTRSPESVPAEQERTHVSSLSIGGLLAVVGVLALVLGFLACLAGKKGERAVLSVTTPELIRARAPFRDWRYIVVHHSATDAGGMEAFERYHMGTRHWPRIGYHFVIGNGHGCKNGKIQVTRTWRQQLEGIHTGTRLYNSKGIGICLVGDFEAYAPAEEQMRSLMTLCTALARRFDIPAENVLGHGEIKNTKCPGQCFPRESFRRALKEHLQGQMP